LPKEGLRDSQIKRDFLPIQYYQVGFSNGEALCFLKERNKFLNAIQMKLMLQGVKSF
jgi:hypothetical protein